MKNKHYEVILMAILFLTPQYLQAEEVTNTINFTGYNNSTLNITTNTNWVSDTIDIKAFSEAHYDMYMYVNSSLVATGMGRLAYGYGDGCLSVTTYTPWVTDTIGITTTGAADRSVLDQFTNSASDGTHIGRNALYIGDGFITTSSTYFNAPEGEVSVTGIYIEGNGYGVLIQRPLEFNAGFGGVRDSTAAVGGDNYLVQQFGYVDADGSGTFTPQNDYRVFMDIRGDHSATITSSGFGSSPRPGPDMLNADTASWAMGTGTYFISVDSPFIRTSTEMPFGMGGIFTSANLEGIVVSNAEFSAN